MTGRILPFFIILLFAAPALGWTPSHKVTTRRGDLYLRRLPEKGILFSFRPTGAATLTSIDNSPHWDSDYLSLLSSVGGPEELKIGQALDLGTQGKVYCLLDPVTGSLGLEVRYREPGQSVIRSVSLEMSTDTKPFPRKLTIKAPFVDHIYGLGEQFPEAHSGSPSVDWKGRIRHSGSFPDSVENDPIGVYGNSLTHLEGGNVANAMFPVAVLADEGGTDALLFLDNPTDSQWDFRRSQWTVRYRSGEVGGALTWGEEAPQLRAQYMKWTGKPPVPPRKAFGLWVSEYGYENWKELEEKLAGLREHAFPVDGFVLDLQWFGGITEGSPDSNMGRLAFDTTNFPNPAKKIAQLASRGIGIIVIEESYIAQNLPEFAQLAGKGYLVKSPTNKGKPHLIDRVPWWGIGSMIDYTNPAAGAFIHQIKRKPLSELGIIGHWTDLGEPEVFRKKLKSRRGKTTYSTPLYFGDKEQLEVNNIFALSWARSIFEGYGEDGRQSGPRPFILTRTGTSGIQRYGTALWSGDIASNWKSLRSHYAAQGHMAWSGVDYYGSDVGGFYRKAFEGSDGTFEELFTRWFAAACLTDIPLRPHTMNLGNLYETSPDRVGDRESNLWNLRRRYRLIPYLYSAAHQAWQTGTPVIGPASMEMGVSGELTTTGHMKLIGPDLLARLILEPGADDVDCLLPDGRWYDFDSGEMVKEGPAEVVTRPSKVGTMMVVPLFARGGATVVLGSPESSKPQAANLELAVFPGEKDSEATIYHDDGKTEAYRGGLFATTRVTQRAWRGKYGEITIEPVRGDFKTGMPSRRDVTLRVASSGHRLQAVVDEAEVETSQDGGFWEVSIPNYPTDQPLTVYFQ